MTDQTAEEWAYIFAVFGKESIREILYTAAHSLHDGDNDRRVVEFNNEEGFQAMDITDHVDTLEETVDRTAG